MNTGEQKIKLTPEQEASINYRGGALLVSAAAGSGKTKVLVERLLSFVDEGANIDEFLVITYTRAAAYELRERIYEELLKRLSQSPGSTRLRRQAMLCKTAPIDTIHTFCSEILRENAHLVHLPPDFRVADESESAMIMNEVADKVLSERYNKLEDYKGFALLVDTIADRRDDKLLLEALLSLHKKLQSSPNPDNWIKEQIEKQREIAAVDDIAQTDFGAFMLAKLKSKIIYCREELLSLREMMKQYPEFELKYAQSVDRLIEQIHPFLTSFDYGWDEARQHSGIEFLRPKPITGYEKLKELRLRCIKELKNSIQELEYSSEEHIKDAKDISLAITALLQLVHDFDSQYSEEKKKRGVADFSDLEHLTLTLLVDRETGAKTELARNISLRFKEIMIDEYQDVNAVQEYIFTAISKSTENIFMVGDVKQSIYRFRLADPTIFLSKYGKYDECDVNALFDKSEEGKKIHLSCNFRSHGEILKVVNHIFYNIMSKDLGELEYTIKEWLIPGRKYDTEKQGKKGKQGILTPVEVDIINMSSLEADGEEESPTAIKIEAEYIARKIEELIKDEYKVPDENGQERTVRYSDIVILLRSVKGRAWQYAAALSEHDIPIEFPGGEGYFETLEVTAALSLLSVIDNPIQDIPLAAVMCGPLYGFTSDELAELRARPCNGDFYSTLKESSEHEITSRETRLKCKKMLADIDELRLVSVDMPSDRFIWHMYNRTGLLDLVSNMRGGDKRKCNLILLAESAGMFERNGYKGIFGFLRFIRNLRERDIELTDGYEGKNSSSEDRNCVKIMSIHKSKGLEFPVVFLSNTSTTRNFQDIRKNVVFHTDLGLGVMIVDKKRRVRYTTLARTAIQAMLSDEMLSEELRVMYVAMTRAREKLIITATLKNTERTLEKLNLIPEGVVAPQSARSLGSMIEWILVGIRGIENAEMSVNYLEASDTNSGQDVKSMVISQNGLLSETKTTHEPKIVQVAPSRVITESKPAMTSSFTYPYQTSVDLPSKLTVTGVKNLVDPDAKIAAWAQAQLETVTNKKNSFYPAPSFISGEIEASAAERGILLHLVMQHIDYNKCSHEHYEEYVEKELIRLDNCGVLTKEQIGTIDVKRIANFMESPLGGRMISAKNLKREFKFSLLRPAEDFYPNGGSDQILLQGVVDCYFEEDEEIVVVDFKTDRVTDTTVDKIARQYSQQLNIYADALFHITGKRVKEKIIYFFSLDCAYYIE
jgi:ATP-dependent helicase/nuclease subunit A